MCHPSQAGAEEIGRKAVSTLLPEVVRPWSLLRSFDLEREREQARVAKAQQQLLDDLADASKRR